MVLAMASLLPQSNAQAQDATKVGVSSLELSEVLDLLQCGHAGT